MTSASVFPRTRVLAVAVAAALLALVAIQIAGGRSGTQAGAATAGVVHITMTVKGIKTGDFKGDAAGSKVINVFGFQNEVISPRDPASGLPTGQRLHKPIVITKEVGASSPQFFNAVATNETLSKVVITFTQSQRDGREVTFFVVTLTNATAADIKEYTSGSTFLEDISFTYQKIEIDDPIAKTSAFDDWESAA